MTFKIKEGVSIAGSQLSDNERNLTAKSLVVNANTGSTDTLSGTLVVTGGVGVSQNLNVGGDLEVGGAITITGSTEITGGLTLGGDLIVNGTTTTLNTTTLSVDDKNIELGSVATPTNTTADGGGITLKGTTDKTITWLSSTGRWTFNVDIESTGIQNTPIGASSANTGSFTTLSASDATTLSGLLNANAGIAVDTDKFTVADTTGNTAIAGTLNVVGTSTLGAITASTGSFSGQITSTVAAGTAPLVVTSTTKVINLNADTVDGLNPDATNTANTIAVRNNNNQILLTSAVLSGSTSGTTILSASAIASGTLTLPATTDTLVGQATTATLTNKTVNLSSNTLTGTLAEFNTALSNADFATLAGTETLTNKTVNLTNNTVVGTLAQFNTALSDADFATLAGTETLTNKTLTNPTINASAGIIVLPASTSPSQTANGSVSWDSDDALLTIGTGSGRKTLVDTDSTQSLTNKTLTGVTIADPVITGISPTITLTGDVTGTGTLTNLGSVSFATTIAANSVALGTDTTGNYIATIAGTANQISVSGSGSETSAVTLSLPQDIHAAASPTFAGAILDSVQIGITAANIIDTAAGGLTLDSASGTTTVDDNLVVSGNLTVSGTTTTVSSTTITVADKNIELGLVETPTDITANGGGITLKGTTDKTFNWVSSTDSWTSSVGLNIATGKSYLIGGNAVLSSTSLASSVVSSSLTSVGTLTGLTSSGDVVVTSTTASSSTTTGALRVAGGLGVNGALYATSINVGGGGLNGVTIGATTASTGAFTTLTANSSVTLTQGTPSTSTTTGTLVVTGGVGISQSLFVGSQVRATSVGVGIGGASDPAISFGGFGTSTGFLNGVTSGLSDTVQVTNGGTITASFEPTKTHILTTTASTSKTTGALVVNGGVGIAKSAYLGEDLTISDGLANIKSVRINTAGTSPEVIDSFAVSAFGSCKYQIKAVSGSNHHMCEITVVQNGAIANYVQYGDVIIGSSTGTFDVTLSGSNVNLTFASVLSGTRVTVVRTAIAV